jgi:hypothetical protein
MGKPVKLALTSSMALIGCANEAEMLCNKPPLDSEISSTRAKGPPGFERVAAYAAFAACLGFWATLANFHHPSSHQCAGLLTPCLRE